MTRLNGAFIYDPDLPPDVPPGATLDEWRRNRSRSRDHAHRQLLGGRNRNQRNRGATRNGRRGHR